MGHAWKTTIKIKKTDVFQCYFGLLQSILYTGVYRWRIGYVGAFTNKPDVMSILTAMNVNPFFFWYTKFPGLLGRGHNNSGCLVDKHVGIQQSGVGTADHAVPRRRRDNVCGG